MRFRKAQAAMEFLMTYGWAILVVLVVIGALAYFGVLNPSKLVPDKCIASAGVSCGDYLISSADTDMKAKVTNGLGSTIIISSVDFTSPEGTGCVMDTTSPGLAAGNQWEAGTAVTLLATCTSVPPAGNKARGTWKIKYYTTSSDFTHDAVVELSATVQ